MPGKAISVNPFETQIYAIRRRLRRNLTLATAAWAGAIFLGLHAVAAFVISADGYTSGAQPALLLGLGGVSVLLGLVVAWTRNTALGDVLMDVDVRFDFKDRISTAHEYGLRGTRSALVELLIGDAARKLGSLTPKQMVPAGLSGMLPLLALLILVNLAIFSFHSHSAGPNSSVVDPETLSELRALLKTVAGHSASRDPKPGEGGTRSIHKRLQDVARNIDSQAPDRRSLNAALDRLLVAVQQEKLQLSRQLAQSIDIEGMAGHSPERVRRFREMSLFQRETLQKLLDQMFRPGAFPPPLPGIWPIWPTPTAWKNAWCR